MPLWIWKVTIGKPISNKLNSFQRQPTRCIRQMMWCSLLFSEFRLTLLRQMCGIWGISSIKLEDIICLFTRVRTQTWKSHGKWPFPGKIMEFEKCRFYHGKIREFLHFVLKNEKSSLKFHKIIKDNKKQLFHAWIKTKIII